MFFAPIHTKPSACETGISERQHWFCGELFRSFYLCGVTACGFGPRGRVRSNVQIDNARLKVGNRQPSTEQTAQCDPGARALSSWRWRRHHSAADAANAVVDDRFLRLDIIVASILNVLLIARMFAQ